MKPQWSFSSHTHTLDQLHFFPLSWWKSFPFCLESGQLTPWSCELPPNQWHRRGFCVFRCYNHKQCQDDKETDTQTHTHTKRLVQGNERTVGRRAESSCWRPTVPRPLIILHNRCYVNKCACYLSHLWEGALTDHAVDWNQREAAKTEWWKHMRRGLVTSGISAVQKNRCFEKRIERYRSSSSVFPPKVLP